MVYSGLGPDYRLLVKRARKIAQRYELQFGEPIPTTQLVQKVPIIHRYRVLALFCSYASVKGCALGLGNKRKSTFQVAYIMQEYTQSGGVRPFGVSLLICGWDNERGYLFQSDPSGAYYAWKATAMGKNHVNGKTFLEKK